MATRRRRKRRRRRRGRFGFLYKLLSFVLIFGAIIAGCIVFFRVEEITVAGSVTYTDEEIIAAAGVELGDNLFLIRRVQVSQNILRQLPYISDVNLRRMLPDGLAITVTECVPAAVLPNEEGGWWVIDRRGKLLESGGEELAQRYPPITGLTALAPAAGGSLEVAEEEQNKLDGLKSLLEALESRELLGQVQSIDLTGSSEIHLSYANRFTVRLPLYSDNFSSLIRTLQLTVDELDARDTNLTGTIDLTVDLSKERARFIPPVTSP